VKRDNRGKSFAMAASVTTIIESNRIGLETIKIGNRVRSFGAGMRFQWKIASSECKASHTPRPRIRVPAKTPPPTSPTGPQ